MESDNTIKLNKNILLNLLNSRRDFLKNLSMLALGGITSLAVPSSLKAASNKKDMLNPGTLNDENTLEDKLFWSDVRSQFVLKPDIIQMNTSTEGAMPLAVISGLYKYALRFAEDPIEACINNEDFEIKQKKNCERVAEFLGAGPEDIVLTTNTTEGMHTAINGLTLNSGDEIITTLHEHGAVTSPLYLLRDRRGIIINELSLPSPPENKQVILDIFERAITAKTKILCFCHINYTTGLQMPVKELCELARDRGLISIVDGAHAIGMINFNVHDLGCDFYACSGHKWLNGPPGTGIFYVRDAKSNPHSLWPVLTEVYQVKNRFPITKILQMRGQQNTPALCAMNDAINFQASIGKDSVHRRILSLNNYLKEKIVEFWGEGSLLTPRGENDLSSGIASFIPFNKFSDRHDRQKFSHIARTLKNDHKINIRNIWFKDQISDKEDTFVLRISTHIFNNYNEIDKVLNIIKDIVNKM